MCGGSEPPPPSAGIKSPTFRGVLRGSCPEVRCWFWRGQVGPPCPGTPPTESDLPPLPSLFYICTFCKLPYDTPIFNGFRRSFGARKFVNKTLVVANGAQKVIKKESIVHPEEGGLFTPAQFVLTNLAPYFSEVCRKNWWECSVPLKLIPACRVYNFPIQNQKVPTWPVPAHLTLLRTHLTTRGLVPPPEGVQDPPDPRPPARPRGGFPFRAPLGPHCVHDPGAVPVISP